MKPNAMDPVLIKACVFTLAAAAALDYVRVSPFEPMAILLALLVFAIRGTQFRVPAPVGGLLLVFFGMSCVAFFFAPDPERSAVYFLITAYLAVLMLTISNLRPSEIPFDRSALWRGYTFGAMVAVFLGLAILVGALPASQQIFQQGRLRATFEDPNVFAAFLVPVAIYWMVRLLTDQGRLAVVRAALLFSAACAGIFLSFSRGAWINLAISAMATVGLLVLGTINQKTWVPGKRTAFLVASGAIVVASLIPLTVASGNFELLSQRLGIQEYDATRFTVQHQAFAQAFQHPLGIGPGSSEVFFNYAIHNLYLRVLVETSLVGGLAFLVFLGMSIARSYRISLRDRERVLEMAVVCGSLSGLLVEAFFIDAIHWRHLWILLGLAWMPSK